MLTRILIATWLIGCGQPSGASRGSDFIHEANNVECLNWRLSYVVAVKLRLVDELPDQCGPLGPIVGGVLWGDPELRSTKCGHYQGNGSETIRLCSFFVAGARPVVWQTSTFEPVLAVTLRSGPRTVLPVCLMDSRGRSECKHFEDKFKVYFTGPRDDVFVIDCPDEDEDVINMSLEIPKEEISCDNLLRQQRFSYGLDLLRYR